VLFDGWQSQHQRLGAQVHPDEGVGRVGIWRDERSVLGGKRLGGVADLVERCLEVRALLVHGLGVQGFVHFHHGETIQIGFLGNATGFFRGGGEVGRGVRAQAERKRGE